MRTYLRVSFSVGLAVCGSGIGGDEGGLLNTEGLCCCMSTSTSSKETNEIKPYLDHHQIHRLELVSLI